MNFEWDENKNTVNICKHKIDFTDVPVVFEKSMLIDYDDTQDYGEERWIGIGLLQYIVVVVVFTECDSDTIRIISARKATRNERERYYEEIF
ncbi:MAG: BrnT family toxin [Desulfococcaceae bacterium]|jgi:uncharacterized DUF497 family protein|nr:BrnT family toxin [Desulfococcaceae bacterium]